MDNSSKRNQLSRVIIRGFKSIRDCDIELGPLNILIGANGSGKSNFIDFLDMMRCVALDNIAKRGEGSLGNLRRYVRQKAGADRILYFGRKVTSGIDVELHFQDYSYQERLEPTAEDDLVSVLGMYAGPGDVISVQNEINSAMRNCIVYHFNDTAKNSPIKNVNDIKNNQRLDFNANNLAAFLLNIRKNYPKQYKRIVETIKLVAPFFVDFYLEADIDNSNSLILRWTHQEITSTQDNNFISDQLSDGTLRFICLATLFLQPEKLQPEIILLDEPELGLHPVAVSILASLIESAAVDKQIIISTQSAELLNHFSPENVIVVDRDKHQSTQFTRFTSDKFKDWLEDYSLGDLWRKNVIGGGPLK